MTDDDFVAGIEQHPADLTRRLVYADWLEERGDSRAQLLRSQVQLIQCPTTNVEHAIRSVSLTDLEQSFDSAWTARVRPVFVENCSSHHERCPRYWANLTSTSDDSTRFCEQCREKVYLCDTAEHAHAHTQLGDRVAVYAFVTRQPDLDFDVFGEIDCWGTNTEDSEEPDK